MQAYRCTKLHFLQMKYLERKMGKKVEPKDIWKVPTSIFSAVLIICIRIYAIDDSITSV